MKKRLIALATLLPALMLSLTTMAGPREDEGWKKIADGALLVDVRSEQEFASGHLDGALLIPYEEVVTQFAARNIPKDQPVVLYCRSGNRAGVAERALREAGYTELFNAGGFTAMAASKPAELPATDATACTPTSGDANC
ncbi:rhodanese-like domain-containing protein [Marinobacterium lutimaris]|uniref:Phage shock protein E n=1 Tax=Marinobacterium lutimaris TaxID=568106 RepID=A0A1H5X4G3_9GAMM|nr:rhodanese-like domain-containing protein [Marinobacterium lutimaris]SEG06237.1 phage shock protein E [Marinobacterium lutimaris]